MTTNIAVHMCRLKCGFIVLHVMRSEFIEPGPEVIRFFMLNSAEQEILNAHKYESIKKYSIFEAQKSLECYFSG